MSDWISVGDIEPESGYRYLVFVDGYIDYFLFCDAGYWCKDRGLINMTGRVTHWMPLPAIPQEEIK